MAPPPEGWYKLGSYDVPMPPSDLKIALITVTTAGRAAWQGPGARSEHLC